MKRSSGGSPSGPRTPIPTETAAASTKLSSRLDLVLQGAALAHEGREARKHFRKIAASLALHADGGAIRAAAQG
jgi:hypothetical protein